MRRNNCIDTWGVVPQYLGSKQLSLQSVGLLQATGPGVENISHFQGKIVQRRKLHGNQEKSKKEETLTAQRGGTSQNREILTGLSGEAPLERLFLFLPASTNFAITAPSDVSQ